jgi:hypothetical protein
MTPLHFTEHELGVFKGTNLYGATLDRERRWKSEWEECRTIVGLLRSHWAEEFTWYFVFWLSFRNKSG